MHRISRNHVSHPACLIIAVSRLIQAPRILCPRSHMPAGGEPTWSKRRTNSDDIITHGRGQTLWLAALPQAAGSIKNKARKTTVGIFPSKRKSSGHETMIFVLFETEASARAPPPSPSPLPDRPSFPAAIYLVDRQNGNHETSRAAAICGLDRHACLWA